MKIRQPLILLKTRANKLKHHHIMILSFRNRQTHTNLCNNNGSRPQPTSRSSTAESLHKIQSFKQQIPYKVNSGKCEDVLSTYCLRYIPQSDVFPLNVSCCSNSNLTQNGVSVEVRARLGVSADLRSVQNTTAAALLTDTLWMLPWLLNNSNHYVAIYVLRKWWKRC